MAEQLTPNFAFPYYQGGDLANGAAQQQALATKVDTVLKPISDRIEFPVGGMAIWMMPTVPDPARWLFCAGQQVDVSAWPALAAVLTDKVAAGKITLPNLKGKIPIGFDSAQTEFDALHETGGSKGLTNINQVPEHDHDNGTLTVASHAHSIQSAVVAAAPNTLAVLGGDSIWSVNPGDGVVPGIGNLEIPASTGDSNWGGASGSHTHTMGTQAPDVTGKTSKAGGTAPAASLPPYVVVQFIIRAA